MDPVRLKLVPPPPALAPTADATLANLAQMLGSYLELPPALDLPTSGMVETLLIPRAHLARWLEMVGEAAHRHAPVRAPGRGLLRWLMALGIFGAGVLAGWGLHFFLASPM